MAKQRCSDEQQIWASAKPISDKCKGSLQILQVIALALAVCLKVWEHALVSPVGVFFSPVVQATASVCDAEVEMQVLPSHNFFISR